MTDITRRNFLKSAGVMALAVAAAGVLSGCNSSSKNPVMEDVKVEYWCKGFISDTHVGDGEYDETVPVLKGSETIKKEQLKNLGKACSGSTSYNASKVQEELTIDRKTNPEEPIVKIYLEY